MLRVLWASLSCWVPLCWAPALAVARPAPPLETLRFESATDGALSRALTACARTEGATWRALPYAKIGNFYSARWCAGAGTRADCQITEGNAHRRDQRIIELSTLYYPRAPRDVFGVAFNALRVPVAVGWGVQLSVAQGGKSILGDGFFLNLYRYDTPSGGPTASLQLGSRARYEVAATRVDHDLRGTPRALRGRFLKSPEALRDLGTASLSALERRVLAVLADHRAHKCRYERRGRGEPGCNEEPLTPAEETAERRRATTYFAAQRALLAKEYQAMFVVARAASLPEPCWPW